jgi:hypothetical protein
MIAVASACRPVEYAQAPVDADTKRTHQLRIGGYARSFPSGSNRRICSHSLPSRDPACPPVPPSGLVKEILGKTLGL